MSVILCYTRNNILYKNIYVLKVYMDIYFTKTKISVFFDRKLINKLKY